MPTSIRARSHTRAPRPASEAVVECDITVSERGYRPIHANERKRHAVLRSRLQALKAHLGRTYGFVNGRGRMADFWTIQGTVRAAHVELIKKERGVGHVWVRTPVARRSKTRRPTRTWFSVMCELAVRCQPRTRAKFTTAEDRLILVQAADDNEAIRKVKRLIRAEEHSYLNKDGLLVRFVLVRIADVCELPDSGRPRSGTEVYYRYRRCRVPSAWLASR